MPFTQSIENHAAVIYRVDTATRRITAANRSARELFGEDLVGRDLFDICGEDLENAAERLRAIDKVGSARFSVRQKTLNGVRWFAAAATLETEGASKSILAVLHDITQEKEAAKNLRNAKEEAEEAARLRDKMVSLVAHDLKAPFAVIMGLLRYLRNDDTLNLNDEHRLLLSNISETGDNLVKMIDGLLNISRLKSGKLVPRTRFADARALAAEVAGSISPLARRKGITLDNNVPPGLLIHCDPELFLEVLRNLLSNSVKFTARGGTVELLSPRAHPGSLAVRDTGTGIRAELVPHLFRHEEKTSTAGTDGETGTGFGLPLCMDIMQAHGGTIKMETAPGKGTTATAVLPVVKPRILFAEDDEVLHLLTRTILARHGWEFTPAYSAEEAMAAIDSSMPHMLITDLSMPGGGFDLLAWVRHERRLNLPVIVITSDITTETREKAFSLGADDFLTKPVHEEDIIPRAKKLLSSK